MNIRKVFVNFIHKISVESTTYFNMVILNFICYQKLMFLAIDKPTRITSFGIIRRVKKLFPGEKIGHSGTLDPMATGLMILAIGKDTKNLTKLIGMDKSYIATIDFSLVTDTRDADYWEKIKRHELCDGRLKMENGKLVEAPTIEIIKKLLDSLIPSAELPLPAFSAKKKEGKRLYALARKGQQILEQKIMNIISYEIISYDFPKLTLQLDVGS